MEAGGGRGDWTTCRRVPWSVAAIFFWSSVKREGGKSAKNSWLHAVLNNGALSCKTQGFQ